MFHQSELYRTFSIVQNLWTDPFAYMSLLSLNVDSLFRKYLITKTQPTHLLYNYIFSIMASMCYKKIYIGSMVQYLSNKEINVCRYLTVITKTAIADIFTSKSMLTFKDFIQYCTNQRTGGNIFKTYYVPDYISCNDRSKDTHNQMTQETKG